MLWNKNKNFCDLGPTCYKISQEKEILKRRLQDLRSDEHFAETYRSEPLPNLVSEHSNKLIKTGKGIDPVLQENKAVNIALACEKLNGLVIRPGETFSFWRTVGRTTKKKGYLDGRVIIANKLQPGLGGGLCNLGNTVHLLALDSPVRVTEFHTHSDALAPDEGAHKPFATGTSVSYNNLDLRFRNETDQDIQLLLWCEDGKLFSELRSDRPFPWRYELVEEDHHFQKEGETFFRVSKIYRETIDRATDEVLEKKLILDNHSEVMFDYSEIPQELIRG